MHHPYQCLHISSGSKLYSVHLSTGAIVSSWPPEDEVSALPISGVAEVESLSKKRKISASLPEQPNITKVKTTSNGQYAVIATAEDKAIRVFEIGFDGQLNQLSQRCMPKRPCAIDILPDNQTVIVGDKFGDVYSLPLLLRAKQSHHETVETEKKPERRYAPTATEKTVHSKANLKALEEQRKQAEKGAVLKTKEPHDFGHELLLGHVSMLTDLVVAKRETEDGVARTYIITADRDEHIRVSRGPPQSYITEGYCLGHSKFVSKLCVLTPSFPELLVSGGSDHELRVWDWTAQKCIKEISMTEHLHSIQGEPMVGSDRSEEAADVQAIVSGLWAVSRPRADCTLLVAYEGIPGLFQVTVNGLYKPGQNSVSNGTKEEQGTVRYRRMTGNVLDVATFENYVLVSLDNIHKSTSITDIDESDEPKSRIVAYKLSDEAGKGEDTPKGDENMSNILVDLNRQVTVSWHEKELQALLYPLGHLRKHGAEGAED